METADLTRFFTGHPEEAQLFQILLQFIGRTCPGMSLEVQKSQIACRMRRAFCWIWLPPRVGIKHRPAHYLILTIPSAEPIAHPCLTEAVRVRPGQWTSHLILSSAQDLDEDLAGLLRAARDWRDQTPGKGC